MTGKLNAYQADPSSSKQTPHEDRGIFLWKNQAKHLDNQSGLPFLRQQEEILRRLTHHNINRVYGAYRNLGSYAPRNMVNWQNRLKDKGIDSYFSMGENTWVCQTHKLLHEIKQKPLRFNKKYPQHQFAGIVLDIEPQALRGEVQCSGFHWNKASLAAKRTQLNKLALAFQEVRQLLDSKNSDMKLIAVLPAWFDNYYPKDTGDFYWASKKEMLNFFKQIGAATDEVTLMAFCRHDIPSIQAAYQTEENLLGDLRITVNAKEEECKNWSGQWPLFNFVQGLIRSSGVKGVDIQSYSHLEKL